MAETPQLAVGKPFPLGPTVDDSGVNFVVESASADQVELCTFTEHGEEQRYQLVETNGVWHGFLEHAQPGLRYGFRVHGLWDPAQGARANPTKFLLDPRARLNWGKTRSHPSLYDYLAYEPSQPNRLDSAAFMPRSVVVDGSFDWEDDQPPRHPISDTIIYETHVKGATKTHPHIPPHLQGTYLGMIQPQMISHLVNLGITAVELMPVQHFIPEPHLLDRGLTNYWGYSPIGWFSPHWEYAATDNPVTEFKQMVKKLHQHGLEVILDVVYNHTAEGGQLGNTLSFRGLDNRLWYRTNPVDPSVDNDYTGTGNTVAINHPTVLRTVMDSLRYWVEEMHVDGFRFDLATTLGRGRDAFDAEGPFLSAVSQDPIISRVKLIAEPWDVGPDGYRLGAFPAGWSEWNDQYRDEVRDFWRNECHLGQFASRISGSSDRFEHAGRKPWASVNFVTSHDGFTLADLVSYDRQHNQVNGEGDGDGHHDNRSWNSGEEGPSIDPEVIELRGRRKRSLLASLLTSQGVPMLLGGDEIGRTQHGNNNPYNQDSQLTWYDWNQVDEQFLKFCQHLIRFRTEHPTLRRTAWLHEHPLPTQDHVGWYQSNGDPMTVADWHDTLQKTLVLYLDGKGAHTTGLESTAELVSNFADLLFFMNGGTETQQFSIPIELNRGSPWQIEIDTVSPDQVPYPYENSLSLSGFGMAVLVRIQE